MSAPIRFITRRTSSAGVSSGRVSSHSEKNCRSVVRLKLNRNWTLLMEAIAAVAARIVVIVTNTPPLLLSNRSDRTIASN